MTNKIAIFLYLLVAANSNVEKTSYFLGKGPSRKLSNLNLVNEQIVGFF